MDRPAALAGEAEEEGRCMTPAGVDGAGVVPGRFYACGGLFV
ncbi:hypothetical protein [Haloferula sp. BvORR071]|nr:hypothetical protein [Haloferula sp. BvORR071]